MSEFDNPTNICWKCQCRKTATCQDTRCQTPRCKTCEETCQVCNLTPQHQKPTNRTKDPNEAPVIASTHTMGTQLYDKTEKARFTTSIQSNNKVRRHLLQTLFTPDDDTGEHFQRKPDPSLDQATSTDYDTSTSSEGGGPPQPNPRTTTPGGHLEFRMQVRG